MAPISTSIHRYIKVNDNELPIKQLKRGQQKQQDNTMRKSKRNKIIALSIIVMLLIYVFLAGAPHLMHDEEEPIRPYEERYRDLKMSALHGRDVPVVIVDQHQEVIPYWYKAIVEGLIQAKGNTIIHIDAHSDTASPSLLNKLKYFQHNKVRLERDFLPLMESNDRFIFSSIYEGFVDRVIWVKPSWLKNNQTYHTKGFVGTTKIKGLKGDVACTCERPLRNGYVAGGMYDCIRENPWNVLNATTIPLTDCKKLRNFAFIEISESNFIEDITFKKTLSVFVDIDEDYFGCESGVENFIEHGVSLKTQKVLDAILPELYSPKNSEDETDLNQKLKEMFHKISDMFLYLHLKSEPKDTRAVRQKLNDAITSMTGKYFLKPTALPEFVIFLLTLSPKQIDSLSKIHFCLSSSQRLLGKDQQTEFSVCHGNVFPNSRFVKEFHIGTEADLYKRGEKLSDILQYIRQTVRPRFYTIARSLRDGYVVRDQQREIEKLVMRAIDKVELNTGRRRKTIYDPFLLFGRKGWIS
ncbi:uncharacterized protein [Clytia hemisphaerica]|uniref:Uncharacterized protein n=1 Tax=Clytia hemisphaerica TaxID=252671 RepID=A0A7M5WXN8_9CNID|eukprot:TCONS_00021550-protein